MALLLCRYSVENIKRSGRSQSVFSEKSNTTVKLKTNRNGRNSVNQIADIIKISSLIAF